MYILVRCANPFQSAVVAVVVSDGYAFIAPEVRTVKFQSAVVAVVVSDSSASLNAPGDPGHRFNPLLSR